MLKIRVWPPYESARRRLDANSRFELEAQLVEWALGLAIAESEGTVKEFAGIIDEVGWLRLRGFRVLARLSVDDRGRPRRLTLLGLEPR